MKIAIIHDWDVVPEQEITWMDGLAAAVKELGKRHQVRFFVCGKTEYILPHPYFDIYVSTNIKDDVGDYAPDVILMWADCTRPNAEPLSELGIPMALCFAGGNTQGETVRYFDHVFVESEVYKQRFEVQGVSVSTAFGTNTELFQPLTGQQKVFDVLFPATFAEWKRHKLFSRSIQGLRSCAVGYMYFDHEVDCWQDCEKVGSLVLPHVSAMALKRLYGASKCVVVTSTAQGGSQRTVLEAMAMNIPVIVMSDSDKTTEYALEGGGYICDPEPAKIREKIEKVMNEPVKTRDYILSKWSHIIYADNLEEKLLELCSNI